MLKFSICSYIVYSFPSCLWKSISCPNKCHNYRYIFLKCTRNVCSFRINYCYSQDNNWEKGNFNPNWFHTKSAYMLSAWKCFYIWFVNAYLETSVVHYVFCGIYVLSYHILKVRFPFMFSNRCYGEYLHSNNEWRQNYELI